MSNGVLEMQHSNGVDSTKENMNDATCIDHEESDGLEISEMLQPVEGCSQKRHSTHLIRSLDGGPPVLEPDEDTPAPLHYRVSETPPVHLLLMFALQQVLINISSPLSVTLVVSEVVCSQQDEDIKQHILSASMFMVGVSTFLMSTFGVRLPIFQGPSPVYLVPLLAMSSFPEWTCPEIIKGTAGANNDTVLFAVGENNTLTPARDIILIKVAKLSGSLMAVGVVHFLIGATGLVGVLVRYIGPVTIAPTIILVGISLYKLVVTFARPSILVSSITVICNLILSLFLANKLTPIPIWTRDKGFHIHWFPLHQMLSVLISILVGWAFSYILTAAGFFTDDSISNEYLARTDAKANIISVAPFFDIPYPGKFAGFTFSIAAFVNFMIATLVSVFDSIGDYSACAKTSRVTPPPKFAFNRGIAVEGLATVMSGSLGCCHSTVSYGGSIAAIGITGVASRRVFQVCGLIFVSIGVLGKVGAFFLTIPLPVLGGCSLVTIGIFIGLAVSYLDAVNLRSTRNLAIIGIALLLGFSVPHWAIKYGDQINTGSKQADMMITVLLSNASLVASAFACFMDNAVPGTLKERGLLEQIRELDNAQENTIPKKGGFFEEGRKVYHLPLIPNRLRRSTFSKVVPIFDHVKK